MMGVFGWRTASAICAGALAFGCTHSGGDDATPAPGDVAVPSEQAGDPPPAPPDPLGPPVVPPAGDPGPLPAKKMLFGVDETAHLVSFALDAPSFVTTKAITGLAQ